MAKCSTKAPVSLDIASIKYYKYAGHQTGSKNKVAERLVIEEAEGWKGHEVHRDG